MNEVLKHKDRPVDMSATDAKMYKECREEEKTSQLTIEAQENISMFCKHGC